MTLFDNFVECMKNTIHSYIKRLIICIITTSGSCDSDFSALTGTTDPHLRVLFKITYDDFFCLCFTL